MNLGGRFFSRPEKKTMQEDKDPERGGPSGGRGIASRSAFARMRESARTNRPGCPEQEVVS
jgi:hypothetical protein